jgi:hypothetical protein
VPPRCLRYSLTRDGFAALLSWRKLAAEPSPEAARLAAAMSDEGDWGALAAAGASSRRVRETARASSATSSAAWAAAAVASSEVYSLPGSVTAGPLVALRVAYSAGPPGAPAPS